MFKGLRGEEMLKNRTPMQSEIYETITSDILTYEMKVNTLAKHAENALNILEMTDAVKAYRDAGIICDLFEGSAPYRPRYIVPDYEKFMKQGSSFLKIEPAHSLYDAINNLQILYRHVPSITTFPVYIGNIDLLLEPYIGLEKSDPNYVSDEAAYQAIKRFLVYIDRTITDSFCHANIGPKATQTGYMILKAERELQDSIPNITLKYNAETSIDFAIDAIKTSMITAKPSFANHDMFASEFGENYAIVSCYNGLPIGGGSYTLARLVLSRLAEKTSDLDVFLKELLPDVVAQMVQYMDERIRFIVEEVGFFGHHFLSKEGLVNYENFTAMFGMVGLAEAVNHFMPEGERFGHSEKAEALGVAIMEVLQAEVNKYDNPHLKAREGHYLLHAQVGIDTDIGISPGVRIPIGEEPPIYEHIFNAQKFHKYFPSGVGDIFTFDQTVAKNPEYVLNIINGAFKNGMRYISFYGDDADVIRITGYLVKKSEIEKLSRGEMVLRDTVVLGKGAVDNAKIYERKVRNESN